MDVSILQHAKDKAPRQMALDEVVELIKGDAWPAGYQPLAVANLEKQLVFRYFRKPTENESGELVDTAMALQVISYNVGPKIYPDKVDAAFADLGFEERTVNGMSGYLAVRRKPEEIETLARLMALDAKQQPPKT